MGSIFAEAARDALPGNDAVERLQVRVVGTVQGVGFRPFVYRLACELKLSGWILNDGNGVTIEVEGPHGLLIRFVDRLQKEKPSPALIYALDQRFLSLANYNTFEIKASQSQGSPRVWILPDLATCSECRNEILSPLNRRYRYPFTNCTHCGPRFTIINSLPYDRPRTSMKDFLMCAKCEEEYVDPQDRRFHAQPNACSDCGPGLEFRTTENTLAKGDKALQAAEKWIRIGRVVAVKGLGGYHLMVDARNETAVARLRKRKRRSQKAFAVMYPDLETLRRHVDILSLAEPILLSAQAPVLLLRQTLCSSREIAPSVAPGSPYLGVFLPYTPLHFLLLRDLGFPVVATSGNRADEPIEHQDSSAVKNLASLCDAFLIHNRPIVHHADDSVLQIITKPRVKPQMLRRARGYTPLPVLAPKKLPSLLALGGHLNATFAVSRDKEIILSQHLGDLESYETRQVYEKTLKDLLQIYDIQPKGVVHDLHPDYYTTELATQFDLPQIAIQHHHAHLAACVLENQLDGSVLGLTWDGTGYGPDHTIWGGEVLLGDAKDYQRVGSLCPFQLPGGERGIKEPWRVALSLLWESFGESFPRDLPFFSAVPSEKIETTLEILKRSRLSPVTTSMGRLFDGFSALLGFSFYNTHQAQSAQLLEYAAWEFGTQAVHLPLPVLDQDILRLDWKELVRVSVDEYRQGTSPQQLAAGFHQAVTQGAIEMAKRIAQPRVVLTGGVFCNRYLTENLLTHLEKEGFKGYIHSQLPPTDGSLAVGQLWAAAHRDTTGMEFFSHPGHSQSTRR